MDKTQLECIQIVAETVAIGIAGAWAIFGFFVFRQRQKALAELRKTETETRQIELASRRFAAVNATIAADVAQLPDDTFALIVTVALQNCGNKDTRIVWENQPAALSVRRVHFDAQGQPVFAEPIELRVRKTKDPSIDATSHVVRAGATETLGFAVRVPAPGVYRISFRGTTSPEEWKDAEALGVVRPTAWTSTRHVAVERKPAAKPPSLWEPLVTPDMPTVADAASPAGIRVEKFAADEEEEE